MTIVTNKFLADITKQHEEWKQATLQAHYTPEQLDWRNFREPPEPPSTDILDIQERHWQRHALMLAQSGSGKSNGLRWRIAQLLPLIAEGKHSLIIMEPKGDLTAEVLGIAQEKGLGDRLIFLEPGDDEISVNLFDIDDRSAKGINAAVRRISRIFSTITSGLTGFQANVLTFALRALFSMPPPRSIETLFDILRNGVEGKPVKLSPSVRNFFVHDFLQNKTRTKEVIGRLNSLLADPVFEALFSSAHTTFDMFNAMQAGRIIIIDAGSADPLYGRFWIEEVDRVIKRRIALPPAHIVPTSFIIDEAGEWISDDSHFAHILDVARGAKIGMFVALQHLGQVRLDHVRNSLLTNTAIKFVAKTTADVFNLCRSLGNVETHFITRLRDYEFAFIAPHLQEAEVVKLPLVEFPRGEKPQSIKVESEASKPEPPEEEQLSEEEPPQPSGRTWKRRK